MQSLSRRLHLSTRYRAIISSLVFLSLLGLLIILTTPYYTNFKDGIEETFEPNDKTIVGGIAQKVRDKQKHVHSAELDSNIKKKTLKTIIAMTEVYWNFESVSKFSKCKYSNCRLEMFTNVTQADQADILLFQFNQIHKAKLHTIRWTRRSEQYWVIFSWESPEGYKNFAWQENTNNLFNLSVTYRSDSEIYTPLGITVPRPDGSAPIYRSVLNEKTKGAFAYVSHCDTKNYDRLQIMKALGEYIQVDIFGKCTGLHPCSKRMDYDCENRVHSKYMFFLSFENSLCKDYITEKFWARLQSPGLFVPVVMGGTSLDEYEKVAPPNSYIHLYNFTSIQKLGMYLRQLMANREQYAKYHEWRDRFEIEDGHNLCKLCRLANEKPRIEPISNVNFWWNDPKGCQDYRLRDIE